MWKLLVPRTHNRLGDRSFSAAGPQLWNNLPPGLRRPGLTFDSFRQSLKTHSFGDRSAFSDSFEFIGTIEISLSIYLSIYISWLTDASLTGTKTRLHRNQFKCYVKVDSMSGERTTTTTTTTTHLTASGDRKRAVDRGHGDATTQRPSPATRRRRWWRCLSSQCSPLNKPLPEQFCAFSASTLLVGRQEGHPALKNEWCGAGVVICLEQGADLHMA